MSLTAEIILAAAAGTTIAAIACAAIAAAARGLAIWAAKWRAANQLINDARAATAAAALTGSVGVTADEQLGPDLDSHAATAVGMRGYDTGGAR